MSGNAILTGTPITPGIDGWLPPIGGREASEVLGVGPVPAEIALEGGAVVRATWGCGWLVGTHHLIAWWPDDATDGNDLVPALNIRAWRPARQ